MRMLCVLAGALLAVSVAAQSPEPGLSKEDIARAQEAVKAHLAKVGGDYARITHLADPALDKAAGGHAFFWVLYPQFPVGRVPPAGLSASNVFVVGGDKKVVPLPDLKSAKKFFEEKARVAATDEGAKVAVKAWLAIGQQFSQDGFYRFTLVEGETKVEKAAKGRTARGVLMVMSGGNGTIRGTVEVNDTGRVVAVNQEAALRPGPRPICQATKLLDRDPVVRAMAEQDLLYLGRSAREYLFEQRAKARPELQRAIDRLWWRIQQEKE